MFVFITENIHLYSNFQSFHLCISMHLLQLDECAICYITMTFYLLIWSFRTFG
jgi:hypothetical protein